MRCLGEVRSEMTEQCSAASTDVVGQFELDLVNPLVQLTRSFVVAECAMSQQYRHYFVIADNVTYRTSPLAAAVVCSAALVALAVARWLVLLGPPD